MYTELMNAEVKRLQEENDQLKTKISVAADALLWAEEMLVARDVMNAKVHCAPVRLSPITERVQQARNYLLEQ